MKTTVKADPYIWAYDGTLDVARTALILIDWQHDFCGEGGYVDQMGYNISLTRRGIAPIPTVLDASYKIRNFTIIDTREGRQPDLSDSRRTNSGTL